MATYTSLGALEAALQAAITPAVDNMAQLVLDQVNIAVSTYYGEFSPTRYVRTGTLGSAPQSSGASGGGGSASAEVYMDTGLGYSTGTWNMENVISAAESGTHGGVGGGATAVWSEPMGICHANSHGMWASALSSAGLIVE